MCTAHGVPCTAHGVPCTAHGVPCTVHGGVGKLYIVSRDLGTSQPISVFGGTGRRQVSPSISLLLDVWFTRFRMHAGQTNQPTFLSRLHHRPIVTAATRIGEWYSTDIIFQNYHLATLQAKFIRGRILTYCHEWILFVKCQSVNFPTVDALPFGWLIDWR